MLNIFGLDAFNIYIFSIAAAKGSMKVAKSEGETLSCTSLQTEAWRSLIICPDTCI